ncbi:C40 family peptidase [Marinitenerispora sediminis]|uniref:Hydrolase n=1 Tax=Marinitenerispora sediminis TaxID=1931232 RepID=A0A368T2C2_9ACTN|nr:C40 family peptidase [Marinitenerispora sediminis]RCV50052.1 hydrolase [Marinitenerispora sediminis]RCV50073.1 hydrolase [Marinitenerispora sediminis]RCV53582.1 hydrolase [Marinitenerispora sediminis]
MIRLFVRPSPSDQGSCATRLAIAVGAFIAGVLVLALIIIPTASINQGMSALTGLRCTSETEQVPVSGYAEDSIPENYLEIYRETGEEKGIPWNVLAGVGQVESHHGRWEGPGITEGHNDWGAAGPMQFGSLDGSAAGNSWGGEPVMPADERPEEGYGQDGNGDGVVSVYDPADAIPAAADYLIAHGARENVRNALYGYNHAWWYVEDVLEWAERYADGSFSTDQAIETAVNCDLTASGDPLGQAPDELTQAVVDWALAQRGKPYVWGGTGPNGFDCSGLLMRAYESIGVTIPRVSQDQWNFGPRVEQGEEQPGDLVFFDVQRPGEPPGPGHVGMVVGDGLMVEAWCTACGPIATREYDDPNRADIMGFTRPLADPGAQAQLEQLGAL